VGVRDRLARLEGQARALLPPAPPEPDDRCPHCGQPDLGEPDRDQLLGLAEWCVEDLTAAEGELRASYCSPYACLAWCPGCARLVVVRAEDVGLEYPPRHMRDRRLLDCLVPCPYWRWCEARKGTTCDHCSGKGILAQDEPEEAESPTPQAPPPPAPTPGPAPPPCGHGERPPPPDEPLGEDEEWVWVPDEEAGDVEAAEAGPGDVG
jgi:hypothetical protein